MPATQWYTVGDTVTVWSRGTLASHWVVERSYPLKYATSELKLIGKPGRCNLGPDGRRYLWLPQGIDANGLPRLPDSEGNPTIYVDASHICEDRS